MTKIHYLLASIFALTLLIWLIFYRYMPDQPLSAEETTVVAGICFLMVGLFFWIKRITTVRSFLRNKDCEEPGFGMYSYILFGAPSTSELVRERYASVIKAFMKLLLAIEAFELSNPEVGKKRLNITYLPMQKRPPKAILNANSNERAIWLLDHYDYIRARMILNRFAITERDGPYIISSVHRLVEQFIAEVDRN